MKKLLKLMYKSRLLDKETDPADNPDGGGKDNDLAAQVADLQAKIAELEKGKQDPKPEPKSDYKGISDDLKAQALAEKSA